MKSKITHNKVLFQPVFYIDRKTGTIHREKIPGELWLKWLYYNPIGKITLETIIKRKLISSFYGKLMDRQQSKKKIEPFVNNLDIDMDDFDSSIPFSSFNDFFTRKLKPGARSIDRKPDSIVSPGDGKLLAFNNIDSSSIIRIKGLGYSLSAFLKNEELFHKFENCSMFVLRLCPADYHRFHFPFPGIVEEATEIKGKYYSVSPHSTRRKIKTFAQNKRQITLVKNEKIDSYIIAEIGATLVGSILQTFTPYSNVEKGQEKGYFKFGGSTVLLLFQKNKVLIDKDLLKNTKNGLETKILMGEKIGKLNLEANHESRK
ncbi:MAG: phosphatidylserine decarboxylase [Candidatus Cloacimonetes bacterium]|nr:phosphatidylserine decarboxylase [Candidatus Cloacimonadota bacterium]